MRITSHRRRAVLAGLLAATAIGSAAPAQAHQGGGHHRPVDCDAEYQRIIDRFYDIEARRGWDDASRWWNDVAWPRYYRICGDAI